MSAPTAVNEYDAITAVAQHYIDGARAGKSDLMKPAFHSLATITGYLGPDLIAGPIQILYDFVDQNPPATTVEVRLASLDITGTTASLRLEIDDWGGHRFTDYWTLVKIDGAWQVLSKVFHLHP
jgi:hypothetical protein